MRKESRASEEVRLRAAQSEGQEKLGLVELGRVDPPFPPQAPCYPARGSTQRRLFLLLGPPPTPGVFIPLHFSSPLPPSKSRLRFWPELVHIITMTVIIIVVVIKYLSARGEERTPALPHSHC